MEISWIYLYGQMKARGMGGSDRDFVKIKIQTDAWDDEGMDVKEYTFNQVVENALIEALSLIPTVAEIDEMVGEIFDRTTRDSKIQQHLFNTQRYLMKNNIKNV